MSESDQEQNYHHLNILTDTGPSRTFYGTSDITGALNDKAKYYGGDLGRAVSELSTLIRVTMDKSGISVRYDRNPSGIFSVKIAPDLVGVQSQVEQNSQTTSIDFVIGQKNSLVTVESDVMATNGDPLSDGINAHLSELSGAERSQLIHDFLTLFAEQADKE